MTRVGFTGTRSPRTIAQLATLRRVLTDLRPAFFAHGAAVGADEDGALIAASIPGCTVVAHPGVSAKGGPSPDRSAKAIAASRVIHADKTHFSRNRHIVDTSEIVIGVPPCRPLPEQGGTAYTLRYAASTGKLYGIIWPDGEVEWHPCPPKELEKP